MRFQYTYKTTAAELWQLSMYYMYGSMVGACNIIFTVAVMILTYVKWGSVGTGYRIALIAACCLFPVFQPLLVYRKARKQAAAIKQETWIGFDDKGLNIKVGEETSQIKWEKIKRISKKPTMLVIFSDTTHGFVLTNRVLGKEREDLYRFVVSRMAGQGSKR